MRNIYLFYGELIGVKKIKKGVIKISTPKEEKRGGNGIDVNTLMVRRAYCKIYLIKIAFENVPVDKFLYIYIYMHLNCKRLFVDLP